MKTGGVAELVEGGGLEKRLIALPSLTSQQLTVHRKTSIWGVLGVFSTVMRDKCGTVRNFAGQF